LDILRGHAELLERQPEPAPLVDRAARDVRDHLDVDVALDHLQRAIWLEVDREALVAIARDDTHDRTVDGEPHAAIRAVRAALDAIDRLASDDDRRELGRQIDLRRPTE